MAEDNDKKEQKELEKRYLERIAGDKDWGEYKPPKKEKPKEGDKK